MDNTNKIIGFRCDISTRAALEQVAKENDLTLSQVVRKAIWLLLNSMKQPEPTRTPPPPEAHEEPGELHVDIMDVILKGHSDGDDT